MIDCDFRATEDGKMKCEQCGFVFGRCVRRNCPKSPERSSAVERVKQTVARRQGDCRECAMSKAAKQKIKKLMLDKMRRTNATSTGSTPAVLRDENASPQIGQPESATPNNVLDTVDQLRIDPPPA